MASVSNESNSLKKVGCLPQVGFRVHRVLGPGISAQVGGEPSFLPMCLFSRKTIFSSSESTVDYTASECG